MRNTTLPLLTASRLRDARACQRLHKHRYFDGYVPLEDVGPLRFGRIFHTALEAWWSAPAYEKLEQALASIPAETDPYEAAMARALLVIGCALLGLAIVAMTWSVL